jgi:hypothetical protein
MNILRKYKYHPYKTQCHQQIFAVDEESKSETCYEIQERAIVMIVAFCRQFASQTNLLLH